MYRAQNHLTISAETIIAARFNNSIILDSSDNGGADPSILAPKGIFFLELLVAKSGETIKISDGEGDIAVTSISEFSSDYSPMRLDKGIIIDGNIQIVKGFIVENVYQS